ncbi:MAG: hypothetical protein JWM55_2053 [Acidimicrobiaceae bacterium]|nr:hypothetical protein [Acidimicrobiaceae bacterium]
MATVTPPASALERPSSVVGEFRRLATLAQEGWSRGTRPWLAVSAALASVLVSVMLHFHVFQPALWRSGDVYASLPLTTELARLPMSLFLPTPYLPLWAACLQLLVVVGLGELILGRWLTIMAAVAGHVGSTLVARALLESVHGYVFGLAPSLAHVLDTGPSAATTAAGACLLVCARLNRSVVLLSVALLGAAFIAPGVDGIEHLIALCCGVVVGATTRLVASKTVNLRLPSWVLPARVTRCIRLFRAPRVALARRSRG